ncbi:membrane protein [Sporomusaceae bacterium FL31]|nr:membrane protein [Sporomusaceae bacterium FL31]GCE33510.1 membrane protein [Sporomusaceae bacterium]
MTKQINNQSNSGSDVLTSYTSSQSKSQSASQSNTQAKNNQASTGSQSNGNQNQKTVIGVFATRSDAETAVQTLRSQGFTNEEINIVSKNQKNNNVSYDDDITDGALTGSTIGGIGGLLIGAGAMVVPGVGPLLAAGPISAAIGGALAGGLAGGLIDWGIPSEASHRYAKEVEQDKILAIIRTNDNRVNAAAKILRQYGAQDVESHDAE